MSSTKERGGESLRMPVQGVFRERRSERGRRKMGGLRERSGKMRVQKVFAGAPKRGERNLGESIVVEKKNTSEFKCAAIPPPGG